MSRAALIALGCALIGCNADVDEPWQLDHDRIIAVRATPPRITAGSTSTLDVLVGRKGGRPSEEPPAAAMVVSPTSLADAVALTGGVWTVTAPDEARLAAARTELGLEPGAPVPLVVGVAILPGEFPSGGVTDPLPALKQVWLGEAAANPVLDSAMVDGIAVADGTPLVISSTVDVPLAVAFEDTDDVNWLTSCGTMHDFDLPAAYITIEPEDPTEGDLALVVRTPDGGVAWRVWPIRAQ